MTPVWNHATLGYPLQNGYSVSVSRKSNTVSVLGGTDRSRAGNPNAAIEIKMVIPFQLDSFVEFKNFWENDINYGEEYFYMTLLTSRGLNQELVIASGGYNYSLTGNTFMLDLVVILQRGDDTLLYLGIDDGIPPAVTQFVFSVDKFSSTGSEKVTNGVNLFWNSGLVWMKTTENTHSHQWLDTVRGTDSVISSDLAAPPVTRNDLSSFDGNGFTLGSGTPTDLMWGVTFSDASNEFGVITWTGENTSGARAVPHNLGVKPQWIIIRPISAGYDWQVYTETGGASMALELNNHLDAGLTNEFGHTEPTDTHFYVTGNLDLLGHEYIAYLFVDETGKRIRLGSYVGPDDFSDINITTGWKPEFVLIKAFDLFNDRTSWFMNVPNFRLDGYLGANSPNDLTEFDLLPRTLIEYTSTGFKALGYEDRVNLAGYTYVYMAVRTA